MMNDSPFISRLVYRLFLLSWIFAVLWVKEYFWWTFTIAALLLLMHDIILPAVALSKTIDTVPRTAPSIPMTSSIDTGPRMAPSNPMSSSIDTGARTAPSKPLPSSGGSVDEGDPDVWREPRPPRSASRAKKP
jgi:hypothetical protein